jgi:hypothetical protein
VESESDDEDGEGAKSPREGSPEPGEGSPGPESPRGFSPEPINAREVRPGTYCSPRHPPTFIPSFVK